MWYVIAWFAALVAVTTVLSRLRRPEACAGGAAAANDPGRRVRSEAVPEGAPGSLATERRVRIAGAGPAGLSAAIALASRGVPVTVHEAEPEVGHRFHGDFQGLENWTIEGDVLEELSSFGIEPTFDCTPFTECTFFGPSGRSFVYRSPRPLWYLVRRGTDAGTLDRALKEQAVAAGVEMRFGSRVERLPDGGIVAHGPRRPDAIAAGYLFETDLPDGAYAALSRELAPGGYAYLLIHDGRGTVASCLFRDFHREKTYVDRTVAFFRERAGLEMKDPRRFGGYGNVYPSSRVEKHGMLFVGEAAGLQDALLGFGMRHAIVSGHLAGAALAGQDPSQYPRLLRRRLSRSLRGALVDRFLFDHVGDRGYEALLERIAAARDPREWLRRYYTRPGLKAVLLPLARLRYSDRRPLVEDCLDDCDCTFCRCEHGGKSSSRSDRR